MAAEKGTSPFVITDFTCGAAAVNLDQRRGELLDSLRQIERQGTSATALADPRIVLLEGSSYERLWTFHGMIWLEERLGCWLWAGQEIALAQLLERWPRYADYCRPRHEQALRRVAQELEDAEARGGTADADYWRDTLAKLRRDLDLAGSDGLPPASR